MTLTAQVRCDICGQLLIEAEMQDENGMMGFGKPKKTAKSNIKFKFEGASKSGDLCFKCGKEIRDTLEEMKEVRRR